MPYRDPIASSDRLAKSAMQQARWPQPGELWSLWDMLKFDASKFADTLSSLTRIQGISERVDEPKAIISDENSVELLAELRVAAGLVQNLGADVAGITISELIEDLEPPTEKRTTTYNEAGVRLITITNTLRRELSLITLFVVTREAGKMFTATEPLFGQLVFERFSTANDDIAEAGKCLALERGTATVFHLMRVMEAGLRALGKELGIPYAPSWEAYIGQLEQLLKGAKYDDLTPAQKAKRPFYQDVLGDLVSIKSAWRNPTMHIVRSYDPAQARVIFEAVKFLMQHLAKELSADPSVVVSTGQSS